MFSKDELIRFIFYWFIPPGLKPVLVKAYKSVIFVNFEIDLTPASMGYPDPVEEAKREKIRLNFYLKENAIYQNRHLGKKLFILCNGPSIKAEDLSVLKGEICMGVSNFYKHAEYGQIKPLYHVTPNVFYENLRLANPDPVQSLKDWFSEMEKCTCEAELFFGSRQMSFIEEHSFFQNRAVHFLELESQERIPNENNVDITQAIPPVQSVPIVCLILGIYMGFKEIYLLGVDHTELIADSYEYFFDRKTMAFKDPSVTKDNKLNDKKINILESYTFLWRQYLGILEVAEKRGISIINLNKHSFLDVFPKGSLSEALIYN
ncbi:hypothetical protein LFX25_07230 [Leptospira sp. FAT2]|uniref:hypothetical protein n=1 Tax=Leptospira sanjuanensis TaxID=2879643 RepID=UPI001EE7BD55|nr:hypothetical protein [Leptospira sanjuanensis]MCG6167617.1 hypothetical protein [Leptospira sanjuanensis]MCG6193033.1 hypothetical protein [Leptospira sanjuanensis]